MLVDNQNQRLEAPITITNVEAQPKSRFQLVEHLWNYAGKVGSVTRNGLMAGLKSCDRFTLVLRQNDPVVNNVIRQLKLFTFISIPYNAKYITSHVQKIYTNVLERLSVNLNEVPNDRDDEGAYLSGLKVILLVGDSVDNFSTFSSAALVNIGRSPIAALSAIGMPLVVALLSLGSVSRFISLYKTTMIFWEIKGSWSEDSTAFKTYLSRKLETKEKRSSFDRVVSTPVLKRLENEADVKLLKETLKKNVKLDVGNVVANAVSLGGLYAASTTLFPALPFVLFAVAGLGRLGLLAYQEST